MTDAGRQRIQQLVESGEREQATKFARGIRYGSAVQDLRITEDSVTIETKRFVGEHSRTEAPDGSPTVEEEGKYEMKGSDGPFEFTVNSLDEDTQHLVEQELQDVASLNEDDVEGEGEENVTLTLSSDDAGSRVPIRQEGEDLEDGSESVEGNQGNNEGRGIGRFNPVALFRNRRSRG